MSEAPRWVKREYRPSDEDGVVYLWLKSFAHSRYGKRLGADRDGSDAELAYWAEHREIVMRLIASSRIELLCDPDDDSVFWAFAVTMGDVVHYAVVKRRFAPYAKDMLRELLGEHLGRACRYTHEPVELLKSGVGVPEAWTFDPYALARKEAA